MKQYCCENWEYCDECPENCPIAQRNKAYDDFNNAKVNNGKRMYKIILLVVWLLVGTWILTSPFTITKVDFGGCWVSLLCFIILNLIEGKRK